jgi:hypothetical protein
VDDGRWGRGDRSDGGCTKELALGATVELIEFQIEGIAAVGAEAFFKRIA